MKETITSYVGLDVHKDSIAIAVAEAGRSAPRFVGTTPPELAALCKALTRCARRSSTLVVYEAGPCGYGWARHLAAHGWRCEVISPAHITRKAAEKLIKTDRLDAVLLARESRAGNLVKVVMPDERDEAIRDLSALERTPAALAFGRACNSKPCCCATAVLITAKAPGRLRTSGTSPRSSLIILPNRSLSMNIVKRSRTPTSAWSGSRRRFANNANIGA